MYVDEQVKKKSNVLFEGYKPRKHCRYKPGIDAEILRAG